MNLAKEISFLLYQHDCVILPDFGAFIVQKRESERNEIASYAKPVSHTITFNNQITNNDGLLANRVSIIENCSYSEADSKLQGSIARLRKDIAEKKSLELAGVGTFYLTQEGKLIFIPYHALNFCKASFGLPKIKFSKLAKSMNEETNKPSQSRPSIPKTPKELTPKEIDTPILVQKQRENRRKYEELQAKRLESKSDAQRKEKVTSKWNSLSLINTLGALFLIAMIVGLIIFEKNLGDQQAVNDQIASILNPADNQTILNEEIDAPTSIVETISTYGIYATTTSEQEANNLITQIRSKYEGAKIIDSSNEVLIISFDDEQLAVEYKNLLQNKFDQKLSIK